MSGYVPNPLGRRYLVTVSDGDNVFDVEVVGDAARLDELVAEAAGETGLEVMAVQPVDAGPQIESWVRAAAMQMQYGASDTEAGSHLVEELGATPEEAYLAVKAGRVMLSPNSGRKDRMKKNPRDTTVDDLVAAWRGAYRARLEYINHRKKAKLKAARGTAAASAYKGSRDLRELKRRAFKDAQSTLRSFQHHHLSGKGSLKAVTDALSLMEDSPTTANASKARKVIAGIMDVDARVKSKRSERTSVRGGTSRSARALASPGSGNLLYDAVEAGRAAEARQRADLYADHHGLSAKLTTYLQRLVEGRLRGSGSEGTFADFLSYVDEGDMSAAREMASEWRDNHPEVKGVWDPEIGLVANRRRKARRKRRR